MVNTDRVDVSGGANNIDLFGWGARLGGLTTSAEYNHALGSGTMQFDHEASWRLASKAAQSYL